MSTNQSVRGHGLLLMGTNGWKGQTYICHTNESSILTSQVIT